jgi:hypothetical protein
MEAKRPPFICPNSCYNRGNAYYGKRDFDGAIADHKKAVELKSDLADYYNKRWTANQNETNYNYPVIDDSLSVRLKPDHSMVLLKPLTILPEEKEEKEEKK